MNESSNKGREYILEMLEALQKYEEVQDKRYQMLIYILKKSRDIIESSRNRKEKENDFERYLGYEFLELFKAGNLEQAYDVFKEKVCLLEAFR